MKIKGITERNNSYRARVSTGNIFLSKDFNFRNFQNKEEAFQEAVDWLTKEKENLIGSNNVGRTSKYVKKINCTLSQEKLKEYLEYFPDTGEFYWIKSPAQSIKVGSLAGCSDGDGYILISFLNKLYKAHRLAFLYMEGELPDDRLDIDHIDGIAWNNSWNNLRKATRQQNIFNSCTKKSDTGVKGLSIVNGKYRANVMVSGKNYCKLFTLNPIGFSQAVTWLQNTRNSLHKEFANHG